MSKFYDRIGFVRTVETEPGIWEPMREEKLYSGDVTETYARWNDQSHINPDLEINHTISILCDNYITQNLFALQYVCYMGRRWKVAKIALQLPRLILTLGSEYYKEDNDDRITSNQNAACCLET